MTTFKYRKEKGRLGKVVKRPVASVEFRSVDGNWVSKYLYIDSGADITLIPRSVGDLLGFELGSEEPIEEIGGIAGALPTVRRRVTIKDVFDAFHITFKQDQGLVVFKKV